MPVRLINSGNVLADALPRADDDCVEFEDTSSIADSIHTAKLYSDVSDDEFSDCHYDFEQEVNQLERDYFDSLHVENVENNRTYADSPVLVKPLLKPLSDFEREHFHEYNVTPDRPCLAFFKTDLFMPAAEIFEALAKDGFQAEHIRCLHQKPSGEIFLTLRSPDLCNALLEKSSFVCRERHFTANDDERPLTFLTIYDAPYELFDSAIIHRLSPYCEVVWYRRGTFRAHHGVFNGLRHYRVRVSQAIPSYLRFGKFQIRLYHDGQTPTCRRCNRSGHKAVSCRKTVCFNYDGLGHTATHCVKPMYRCICKSGQHLARSCPLSWHREPTPSPSKESRLDDALIDESDRLSHMEEDFERAVGTEIGNEVSGADLAQIASVDLVYNQPQPTKRPLVVDPESVLAEQTDAVEQINEVLNDGDQSELGSPPVSDVSPLPGRVLDSQGLLMDVIPTDGQPGVEGPSTPFESSDPTLTIDRLESPPVMTDDISEKTSSPSASK